MHNHHLSPAALRARLIRGIDPCQIRSALLLRGGEILCAASVWRYRKASAFAGLAMALSGTIADGGQSDYAMVISALPEGIAIQSGDELKLPDGGIFSIAGVSPWPAIGEPAVITLALKER